MSAPFSADLLTEEIVVAQGSLESDASFMLPVFLRLAIQAGQHVLLVSVRQNFAHYKQALRKQGISLDGYLERGQLTCIDLLTNSHLLIGSEAACVQTVHAAGNYQMLSTVSAEIAAGITAAKARATEHLTVNLSGGAAPSQPQMVVMFDGLTELCGLIGSRECWSALLRLLLASCRRYSNNAEPGVSIFAVLNSDELDEDTEGMFLSAASLTINILPLAAGHSVDVSGRVEITQRDCRTILPWATGAKGNGATFYFKSTDSSVKFFQFYDAA